MLPWALAAGENLETRIGDPGVIGSVTGPGL